MRQLKFKVLHKESNKVYDVFSFCDDYVKIISPLSEEIKFLRQDFEPIIQFTGLKDKNKLEIWENDNVTALLKFNDIYHPVSGKVTYKDEIGSFVINDKPLCEYLISSIEIVK